MSLVDRIKNLITQRRIIMSMASRNLRDKYVGSALGILWAVVNPLLIMLAVSFVFTKFTKTEIRNFPLLVLSALLPWFFFVNSMTEATTAMKKNIELLSQFTMSREIIPLSITLANFLNFLFGFVIILPVFVIFNPRIIGYIWMLPLIMSLHFVFSLGVAVLFSILNVYFKDLSQMLNVGIMFLFWVTPIFYPMEMIPENYRWLILANPGTCYVAVYRSLLYQGSPGGPQMWILAAGFALLSIIFGYGLFIRKETDILKYV